MQSYDSFAERMENKMKAYQKGLIILCMAIIVVCFSGCNKRSSGTAVLSPEITLNTSEPIEENERYEEYEEYVEFDDGPAVVISGGEAKIIEAELSDDEIYEEDIPPEELEPILDTSSASNIIVEPIS